MATSIATDPVADAGVPFAARATEVDALFAAAPSVDVVLAGTGKPGRLRQLAGLVTTAAAKSVGRQLGPQRWQMWPLATGGGQSVSTEMAC